jgi:hypothetical protein
MTRRAVRATSRVARRGRQEKSAKASGSRKAAAPQALEWGTAEAPYRHSVTMSANEPLRGMETLANTKTVSV